MHNTQRVVFLFGWQADGIYFLWVVSVMNTFSSVSEYTLIYIKKKHQCFSIEYLLTYEG